MAIIEAKTERGFRAGHFLAHEECTRQTYQVPVAQAKELNDGSYLYSAGDVITLSSAIVGVCYEDVVYEGTGGAIISIVTAGTVYKEDLTIQGEAIPAASASTVASALTALGIKQVTKETVTRPFAEE